MAGFLGFLDFTREGPGVRKDAPKKKVFFVFFETYFRNFWRFILINVMHTCLSLPIVTGGMARAGITNITRNIARDKHSFGISDYFDTIRRNWKQSLAVGIINLIITAILGWSIYVYFNSYLNPETKSFFNLAGFAVCMVIAIVFSIMKFYIYTLMITFDFSIKMLYKNSFKFVFANLWKNLLCGICLLLVHGVYVVVGMLFPYWSVILSELLIAMITLPAFKFLLIQFFTFGSIKKLIIDPYYAEHPDADIEKRRNLGLEVPEDEAYDDMSWE